jgi:hypothetical protein
LLKLGSPRQLQEEFKIGDDIEIIFAPGESVIKEFQSITGIASSEKLSDERWLLHLDAGINPDDALKRIYGAIAGGGFRVRSVRLVRPGLEEVYLQLTGGLVK